MKEYKSFELDKSDKKDKGGCSVYRIIYTMNDDSTLKGGYIDKKSNLKGNAMILDDAVVYGNSIIKGNAHIIKNTVIGNESVVGGNITIEGYSTISNTIILSNGYINNSNIIDSSINNNSAVVNSTIIKCKLYDYSISNGSILKNVELHDYVTVENTEATMITLYGHTKIDSNENRYVTISISNPDSVGCLNRLNFITYSYYDNKFHFNHNETALNVSFVKENKSHTPDEMKRYLISLYGRKGRKLFRYMKKYIEVNKSFF